MPIAREKFFLGHSLVSTKVPKAISLKDFEKIKEVDRPVDTSRFGLWEVSAPDFNKYYPDVTVDDLNPKEEDFSYPIARALSEIIVNKWGPIDFTANGALKASIKKLVGQTLYTNHEAIVGNEVGVVVEAFWEKLRKYDGFEVPAGINVKLKIDGKSNPKLVRSMMSEPPSVHSLSVTISFKWEKSHPEWTDEEFWNKYGGHDEKGELVRRVVTEVFSYDEISLVSHGADPYAQIIQDDKIVNPGYADNHYNFSAEQYTTNGTYFDWKEYTEDLAKLSLDNTIPLTHNNNFNSKENEPTMNAALKKFLQEKFGLDDKATEEQILAKAQERFPILLAAEAANPTKLTSDLTTATQSLTALQAKYPEGTETITPEQKTTNEVFKATAEKATKFLRDETLRFYHLSIGGPEKADASITKLIADAGYDTAVALEKQYKAASEAKFTHTCGDCGGTNVTRSSAAANEAGLQTEGGPGGKETPKKAKSNDEVMDSLSRSSNFTGGIHGELEAKKD